MLFNSYEFLIFFPLVTILFYLLPYKYRWLHLLAASCYFYMFFIPQYILILLVTIIIDYAAGIFIEKETNLKRRKTWLVVSIISTVSVLFIFKYFNFFNQNILELSHILGFYYPEKFISIALPIGLSFHTFQSLSYVIEVYRGKQKAEKHFGIYSLYVMFYPQLVTGPIERPQNLLRQLREIQKFDYSNLRDGLRLIIWGLFVKMVIADNLGSYVDQIYNNPTEHSSLSIAIGLIFYSFQIYGDFFGYSTIAIGCAKAMGFNLIDNFKNPYHSQSISEFWQRWHISLSTWFRDYVYFSLGGNRVKISRWMINIIIVFALSGLWHGANWTFVAWGLAHGLLYILETLINKILPQNGNPSRLFTTIKKSILIFKNFIFVTLIWVLFRSVDIAHVKNIFTSLVNNINIQDNFTVKPIHWFFLVFFLVIDNFLKDTRFDKWTSNIPLLARWSVYLLLIYFTITFSSVVSYPFIYFQF